MSKSTILLISFLVLVTASLNADGSTWKSLFDGNSLNGWNGNPKFWSVQDGCITGMTTTDNPTVGNTFIFYSGENKDRSPVEFGDFELKVSYRIEAHNSGIQYRSFLLSGANDGWRVGGYQSDIDFAKNWSGTNYGERFRGILAKRGEKATLEGMETITLNTGKIKEELKRKVEILGDSAKLSESIKDAPEWNEMVIIAKGHHFIQKINGVTMSEVIDNDEKNRRATGLIAIQLHAGPAMKIQIKSVEIKQ